MGYKRAGFHVLGNVEIDPVVNAAYVRNLQPELNYCCDLRDFNLKADLPEALYSLDILDGSPPCTTFSMAGDREAAWGVEKVFREGAKAQRLDDLFSVFLDTVERLQPKIVVAENVAGLLAGNARGYVNEIIRRLSALGYVTQIFRLNASRMDVPQRRERVFFIARRIQRPKLVLSFTRPEITFGAVRSAQGGQFGRENGIYAELLQHRRPGDGSIADISQRVRGNFTGYNNVIAWDDRVAPTLTSSGCYYRGADGLPVSVDDLRNISTFPQDYDFGDAQPKHICGMSVPPNMMAHIATEIRRQWLYDD